MLYIQAGALVFQWFFETGVEYTTPALGKQCPDLAYPQRILRTGTG